MIDQNSKTLLEVRDLHAKVNDVEILKGVNLTVRCGEIHAIMGLNGSGKSNILDAIQFLLGSTSKEMLRLKSGLT